MYVSMTIKPKPGKSERRKSSVNKTPLCLVISLLMFIFISIELCILLCYICVAAWFTLTKVKDNSNRRTLQTVHRNALVETTYEKEDTADAKDG